MPGARTYRGAPAYAAPMDPAGPTDETFRRRGEVLHRACGADVVLLVPGDAEPLLAGGAAALLWHALEEPRSLAEVARWVDDLGLEGAAPDERATLLDEAATVLQVLGAVEATPAAADAGAAVDRTDRTDRTGGS